MSGTQRIAATAVAAAVALAGLALGAVAGSATSPAAASAPTRVSTPTVGDNLGRSGATATRSPLRKLTPLSEKRLAQLRRKTTSAGRWNIVVINTDDQPAGTEFGMPTVRRELIGRGVTYSAGLVPTAVCCPSRASFLTGNYAGSTGVYDNTNGGVPGGAKAFFDNGNDAKTFAVALKQAGYRTGLFGKYLNHYWSYYSGRPPSGWNEFLTFIGSSKYRDYVVSRPFDARDRRRVRAGKKPRKSPTRKVDQYSTTFFGKATARFIRNAPKKKPLLAVYTPYAPHMPATPQGRYRGTLTDTGWWRTDPSVMEADVGDKPLWVGATPVSSNLDRRPLGSRLLRQRESLLSVDDEVQRIIEALKRSGRLSRTAIFFTSDNGYMHGQHRLSRKGVPYRGATEVPLVMRLGESTAAGLVESRAAAANVDVTATILGLAGLPNTTQGQPLLAPDLRAGVPLLGVAHEFEGVPRPPYCGWRTPTELFVRYGTGEEEFYDYTTDPHELDNAVADPTYAPRVEQLRTAARSGCLPTPPDYGPAFDSPTWEYGDRIPQADRRDSDAE